MMVRTEDDRLSICFRTRAPESDLLAYIDAWGGFELVPTGTLAEWEASSLIGIARGFYGPSAQTAPGHERDT